MEKLSFYIKSQFQRPCFAMKDTLSGYSFNCMYDTGAVISVWCKSEDMFIEIFKPRYTGLIRNIRGIEGDGRICKVYLIDIKVSNLLFVNVPVVVFDEADKNDFIISHTLFSELGVYLDKNILSINTYDNESVRVYNVNSIGSVYTGIALQCEGLIECPICGNKLSSDGICFNPMCEFSSELYDK